MAGAISLFGNVLFGLPSRANQINYDNTNSGLSATQVQAAIDELASEKKDEYETITFAQWQQMTPAQKAAKDYYISDYPSSAITAGNVSYNNSSSGMSADDVQEAVDELKSGLTEANGNINSKIGLATTTNLDDCWTTGIYTFNWNATSVPSGHSGVMLVMRIPNSDIGVQIARVATENTIYVRFLNEGVFTQWKTVTLGT